MKIHNIKQKCLKLCIFLSKNKNLCHKKAVKYRIETISKTIFYKNY